MRRFVAVLLVVGLAFLAGCTAAAFPSFPSFGT
jgi:hypothetical protein